MSESIPNPSGELHPIPDTETLTATKNEPCPLCGKPDWCFLVKDSKEIFKVVCGRMHNAPNGWTLTGISKDNRNIFTRVGRERRRYHLPNTVNLTPVEKPDRPQWIPVVRRLDTLKPGDLIRLKVGAGYSQLKKLTPAKGDKHGGRAIIGPWQYDNVGKQEVFLSDIAAIHTDDTDGSEHYTEYIYTCPTTGTPIGKTYRQQWSDRRKVYAQNTKTKLVLPYHWAKEYQEWKLGKGGVVWPLYREAEALGAIANGEPVFLVGGEQAVECYRELGLTATCSAGGEGQWKDVLDALQPAIESALGNATQKPLLVIHPDHDICGEVQFSQNCLVQRQDLILG